MSREEVDKFIEIVRAIMDTPDQRVALSQYLPREVADALQQVIDSAVAREREACAVAAESAAEPSGVFGRGDTFKDDPVRRDICLKIAHAIRRRGRN
jgi:hypothetical protein